MNVDHSWNDINRGKQKYWEIILLQCHCVHHRYHIDCPGIETKPPAVRIRLLTPMSHEWLFLKNFYAGDQEFPAFTE
jgi:hypothetical protein